MNAEHVKLNESIANSLPEPATPHRNPSWPLPIRVPRLPPPPSPPTLHENLVESILARLGFGGRPEPTLGHLRQLYGEWCQRVPFDNVRKLIHLHSGRPGPLPGATPEDFFRGWLKHGTGGTCWAGAGALHALLTALGFSVERVIGTMLVAPGLPPNHGSVLVTFDKSRFLVDTSILHGEPLRLEPNGPTSIWHPAWGVRCFPQQGRWSIGWRPLLRLDGLDCRLEDFGAEAKEFEARHDQTRGWSPFNNQVTARVNRGQDVIGLAFGHLVMLHADGTTTRNSLSSAQRREFLIEEFRLSPEMICLLPDDVPTPPPPGSQTAQNAAREI